MDMKILILPLFIGILLSCSTSKDEEPMDNVIALSETSIELDFEEEFVLDASFNREGYSESDFLWESDNEDIASISFNGTVKGERVGTATITVKTSDGAFSSSCEVLVNPTNFLYEEPLLDFGQSLNFVKSNESRIIEAEVENALLFEGENLNVRNVMYTFENNAYNSSIVMLANTESVIDEASSFLEQRYEYLGNAEGVYYFKNENVNAGASFHNDFGFNVMYWKNDLEENSRIHIFGQMNEMLEQLKRELSKLTESKIDVPKNDKLN